MSVNCVAFLALSKSEWGEHVARVCVVSEKVTNEDLWLRALTGGKQESEYSLLPEMEPAGGKKCQRDITGCSVYCLKAEKKSNDGLKK